VLSGFRLDLLVKSFPRLFADTTPSCSSRSRSVVAVYPCHVFSTRDTESFFHSLFGATEHFLDYNLLPARLPVLLFSNRVVLLFLIDDLARSRVQERITRKAFQGPELVDILTA
jgi:hypothetical protein